MNRHLGSIAIAAVLTIHHLGAGAAESLVPVQLPEGIEVAVPSDWKIIADSRISGMRDELAEVNPGRKDVQAELTRTRTVFYAVSGPGISESITVNVSSSPNMTMEQAGSITAANYTAIARAMESNLREQLRRVGSEVTEFYGTKKAAVDGKPSFVTSYERTSGSYRKLVEIYQVFGQGKEYTIAQSIPRYDDAETRPRMDAIRASIRLAD